MTITVTCTRCKKLKPPSEGNDFKMCEVCRERLRIQYARHRAPKEKAYREWMQDMKGGIPCTDCGASYPEDPTRMVWDHLPGSHKVGKISDLVMHGKLELALEEIEKCELVCNSCHAKRGVFRGQIVSGPQSTRCCDFCGDEFRYRASQHRRFCSRQCSGAARKRVWFKIYRWPKGHPRKHPAKPTRSVDWWLKGQTVIEGGPPRLGSRPSHQKENVDIMADASLFKL